MLFYMTDDPDWNCNSADETNSAISQNLFSTNGANNSDCNQQANNMINEMPSLHDLAVRYLIKVKEGNRLSNKATQNIAAATSQLFDIGFEQLEKRIEQSLSDVGLNIEDVPGISDCFDEILDPFDGLMST